MKQHNIYNQWCLQLKCDSFYWTNPNFVCVMMLWKSESLLFWCRALGRTVQRWSIHDSCYIYHICLFCSAYIQFTNTSSILIVGLWSWFFISFSNCRKIIAYYLQYNIFGLFESGRGPKNGFSKGILLIRSLNLVNKKEYVSDRHSFITYRLCI